MLQIVTAELGCSVAAEGIQGGITRMEGHHTSRRAAPVERALRSAQHLYPLDIVIAAYTLIHTIDVDGGGGRRREWTWAASCAGAGSDAADCNVVALHIRTSGILGVVWDGCHAWNIF